MVIVLGTGKGETGKRPGDRSRGASLVEFALVAPLLFALLLGTITGGLALSAKNSMTNAVREGARLGATLPEGTSWNGWATIVRDRVVELSGGDLTNAQVCVRMVTYDGTASPSVAGVGSWPNSGCPFPGEPTVPANTPDGSCVVLVWASNTEHELQAFFFSRDLTLEAKAVGRYERSECP